jgi:5-methylthioadenosine/S-adenosylhomocysteine deaminase
VAAGDPRSQPVLRLLTARWVFPIAAPPIQDGAVLVRHDRILQVGPRAEVSAPGPATRLDLGDAAILPGLVNCHTHLELTAVEVGAEPFVPWLLAVRARREALGADGQAAAARAAAAALAASGVTCVGEVSTTGQSLDALAGAGLRGVVYREVLGVDPHRAAATLAGARDELARLRARRPARVAVGLSPHSPYALSEPLLRGCARLARQAGIPVCIHVAESWAEVEYLRRGEGDIPARLYPAVGVSPPPRRPAWSPVAYLDGLEALLPGTLLVHAVHVDEDDRRRMRRRRVRVAHCPRSNRRLSGGTAPVGALLAHGIPVGLGTDSLASAPTLDLWDEMRAARDAGGLRPSTVLELATLGGARALGLGGEVGSLEAGKQADLIVVSAEDVDARDPEGSLLAARVGADVRFVLIAGQARGVTREADPCA